MFSTVTPAGLLDFQWDPLFTPFYPIVTLFFGITLNSRNATVSFSKGDGNEPVTENVVFLFILVMDESQKNLKTN